MPAKLRRPAQRYEHESRAVETSPPSLSDGHEFPQTLPPESETPVLDAVSQAQDGPIGDKLGFEAPDEAHKMWFEVQGDDVELMIASTPAKARSRLEQWKAIITNDIPENSMPELHKAAWSLLEEAIRVLESIAAEKGIALQRTESGFKERKPNSKVEGFDPKKAIENALEAAKNDLPDLAYLLTDLYTLHFNVVHGKDLAEGNLDPAGEAKRFGEFINDCSPSSKEKPTTSAALFDSASNCASFGTSIVASDPEERQRKAALLNAIAKPGTKELVDGVKKQVRGDSKVDDAHKELGSYESRHVARPVENCAEVEAIDRAMWVRAGLGLSQDKDLGEMSMATVQTSIQRQMDPCRNCETLTKDMDFRRVPSSSSDSKDEE